MALIGHASNQVGAATSVLQELTGAGTAAATSSIFALLGSTFADTNDVETAIEAAGDFAITVVNGEANDQNTSFVVLYSDGVNAYLATARQTTADGTQTTYASGALTVANIATIVGVTSIAAGTFVSADFVFI